MNAKVFLRIKLKKL